MVDLSPERIAKILEMRKNPEKASKEDIKSLADDFILMTYSANPFRNIACKLIESEEDGNNL